MRAIVVMSEMSELYRECQKMKNLARITNEIAMLKNSVHHTENSAANTVSYAGKLIKERGLDAFYEERNINGNDSRAYAFEHIEKARSKYAQVMAMMRDAVAEYDRTHPGKVEDGEQGVG